MKTITRLLLVALASLMFVACGTTSKNIAPDMMVKQKMKEAKAEVTHITPAQLKAWIDEGKKMLVYDVRTRKEFAKGHIPVAESVPRGLIEWGIGDVADADEQLVIYCAVGGRGTFASKRLMDLGYKNVYNLQGGYKAWAKAGYPTAK